MKKKILSLMLGCVLTFSIIFASACGKDDSYKIQNFKQDLLNVEQYKCVTVDNNKLKFDVNKFYNEGEQRYLINALAETAPYTIVEEYNFMLESTLNFVYENAKFCEDKNLNIEASKRDDLKQKLEAVKNKFLAVDDAYAILAERVSVYHNSITNAICLSKLEDLTNAYQLLIDESYKLTQCFANIYFNNIINYIPTDYSQVKIQNFNATSMVSGLKAKTNYQKCLLTKNYYEVSLDKENVVTNAIHCLNSSLGEKFTEYKNKVLELKEFESIQQISNANMQENKVSIYNWAIELYNIEQLIVNSQKSYNKACDNYRFAQNVTAVTLTKQETIYKNIINNRTSLLNDFNGLVKNITDIIGD